MKERGASPLDEIELRIHLVGAVDGEIDGFRSGIVEQRKPGFAGHTGDIRGSGERFEARQLAGGMAAGDFPHGMNGGGTGAESNGHARFDVTCGVNGGFFFERVSVGSGSGHGGTMPEGSAAREDFSLWDARALTCRREGRSIRG